jgi:DNA ligase D-like protein (predicted 3'-phosphoesterase)
VTVALAIRAVVDGEVQGVGFRAMTVQRARALSVKGWVRNEPDGSVLVHAEGPKVAIEELVAFLHEGPPPARVGGVSIERVAVEGHEQFAVRGVSAGSFLVSQHSARERFQLSLEVNGSMRSWALPKGPSLDPSVRRLAIELAAQANAAAVLQGARAPDEVTVWDSGSYEQGGRVPWPQALARGHAVFVLNGQRLRGGFALQRTGRGDQPQWLLIKRRDQYARPDTGGAHA